MASPPLAPSDIAVLARTGAQLQPIAEALTRIGVRVAAQDGQRPKDKPAIRAALDQLRLLVNPRDADAFGRVARSAKGMGEATLKSVLREAGIDSGRGGDGDGGGGGDGRLALMAVLRQYSMHNGGGGGRKVSAAVAAAAKHLSDAHRRLTAMLDRGCGVAALLRAVTEQELKGAPRAPSVTSSSKHHESQPAPRGSAPMGSAVPMGFTTASSVAACGGAAPLSAVSAITGTGTGTGVAATSASGSGDLVGPYGGGASSSSRDELTGQQPKEDELGALLKRAEAHDEEQGAQGAEAARRSLRTFLLDLGLDLGGDGDGSGGGGGGVRGGSVALLTTHRAKGLEWRVVLLAGVEDGLYPHSKGLREASGSFEAAAASLREEQRLLYVGATRARERLVLSRTMRRGGAETRPCPFVRALPTDGLAPRVFLPPCVAAEFGSVSHNVAREEAEEQSSSTAARRLLDAMNARLQAAAEAAVKTMAKAAPQVAMARSATATTARAAAVEEEEERSFLRSFYGANYLEAFAIGADTSDDGSECSEGDASGGKCDGGWYNGVEEGSPYRHSPGGPPPAKHAKHAKRPAEWMRPLGGAVGGNGFRGSVASGSSSCGSAAGGFASASSVMNGGGSGGSSAPAVGRGGGARGLGLGGGRGKSLGGRSGTLMAREGAASSVSGYNGGTLNGMLCGGGGMLSSSGGNGLLSGGGGRAFNGGIRLTSASGLNMAAPAGLGAGARPTNKQFKPPRRAHP